MIFEYLPSLMNTTALGIGFYNKNKNCLEFDNFIERGIEIPSFSLDLDDSISLSVMCFKNREIIMRNDLSEEYKAFLENQKDNHFKELPYSMIHVPLILLEQPIGVIVVNSNKKNAYTEDDVINLQTLASYLSIAIDNAKAYGIIENNNTQIIKQNEEYQKLNEELFIAKEKAEESDRLKTAFLQNLSHEIRTPMNAIYGFSERLSKPNLTEEKRLSYISIIQSSSNNLLSIVTDILTISSIVTKQEKINISKVCINKVIGDILPEFHKTALNKNITLNVNMELSDMESEIFTDSVKITYILKNLISNALKFSETGMIVVGYILKKDSDIDVIEFFVKDNGIGIKPELQKKIFEPFRQGDVSKQSEYGGTGLGLSIAKGFVELLGGKIWVQSEYTKGSTFYFTIPYKLAINIA